MTNVEWDLVMAVDTSRLLVNELERLAEASHAGETYNFLGVWKELCYTPTQNCIQDLRLSGFIKAGNFELQFGFNCHCTERLNKILEDIGALIQILD